MTLLDGVKSILGITKPVDCIIFGNDGTAWLQTTDDAGVRRWSYLGRRSAQELRKFCVVRHLLFVTVFAPDGYPRDASRGVPGAHESCAESVVR